MLLVLVSGFGIIMTLEICVEVLIQAYNSTKDTKAA